jgi:hypothetical protein
MKAAVPCRLIKAKEFDAALKVTAGSTRSTYKSWGGIANIGHD